MTPTPRELDTQIDHCLGRDRHRFRRRLRAIEQQRKQGEDVDDRYLDLAIAIEESARVREAREKAVPKPTFPEELPVVRKREVIADAIRENQVVVLCGETGSGKTTQVPKICLEIGRGIDGLIGHTQPRRVAARSVARRIADELETPLAKAVGYKIRFSDYTSPQCYIKLMTDGILLAETQGDRFLNQYDTIIIDEAHERSLNIDFLLGYIRQILPKRSDLKVIVMSATIDPERFSAHFDGAPIVEVSGRMYPVEVRYRPVQDDGLEDAKERTQQDAILDAIDELAVVDADREIEDGERKSSDILVFLSGEREIRETAEALRKHHPPETEILPLYARLSAAEQDRVFKPHPGRRIVLATNVAETSLTVPGIRYVVDPGFARISRYSRSTKVQRLPIEPISQASANQRTGRCGRLSAGVCIRLYSETDFANRTEYTDPEIVRSNLAGVILQMTALQLGNVEAFPFIDPPDPRLIRDGYQTLHELGAIDDNDRLTTIGKSLAKLPVDPRIGRMLLAASDEHCLSEVLVMASALSIQDPRERPMDVADEADRSHAEFRDERSDFIAICNLWDFFQEQSRHLSKSKWRKMCKERFLSYLRIREWEDIYKQLRALMRQLGHSMNDKPADYDAIHRALLTGLLSNIGLRTEKYEYTGTRGSKFNLFPGSGLFDVRPKWVMCAELVRTTRLYARTVARIQPEWIERVAPHLVRHSYSQPHWQEKTAHVSAFEKVSLWGLPIVERRRVHYGPVNPKESRQIFIQHALVLGEYRSKAPYVRHNRRILEQADDYRARTRRHDLLFDEQLRYDFFDARIPAGIYNGPLFERWRKKVERKNRRLLFMSLADVLGEESDADVLEKYPDEIVVNDTRIALKYIYEPGSDCDGITAVIPLEALASLPSTPFEWLVPGHLPEKVRLLIRSLPKGLRTAFQPVSEFVTAFVDSHDARSGSLLHAIAACAKQKIGADIPVDAFRPDELPNHLLMRFEVIDRKRNVLAAGRDLHLISDQLRPQIARALSSLSDSQFNRTNVTRWDFGDLPVSVDVARDAMKVRAFPAIVDARSSAAALQLFQSRSEAESHMRAGLRRLAMLELGSDLTDQARNLPRFGEMSMHFSTLGPADELRRELIECIADRAFFGDMDEAGASTDIRTRRAFDEQLVKAERRIYQTVGEVCTLVRTILNAYHEIDCKLQEAYPEGSDTSVNDIEIQLGHLMRERFLLNTPWKWLTQYTRYIAGMMHRLDRIQRGELARDAAALDQVRPFWYACLDAMEDAKKANKPLTSDWIEFRFLVEEFRISVFAQKFGTVAPVSAKRLRQQLDRLMEQSSAA